jgi:hypothetical protein
VLLKAAGHVVLKKGGMRIMSAEVRIWKEAVMAY